MGGGREGGKEEKPFAKYSKGLQKEKMENCTTQSHNSLSEYITHFSRDLHNPHTEDALPTLFHGLRF